MLTVYQLLGAEAVDLIASETQRSIFLHHLGVTSRVGSTIIVCIVLPPVDFNDDAATVRNQQQEVHALTDERTSAALLKSCIWVVVQVHLWNQCGQAEPSAVA